MKNAPLIIYVCFFGFLFSLSLSTMCSLLLKLSVLFTRSAKISSYTLSGAGVHGDGLFQTVKLGKMKEVQVWSTTNDDMS